MTDAEELINRYNSLITKTHDWLEKEKLRQKIKFIQINEKKIWEITQQKKRSNSGGFNALT